MCDIENFQLLPASAGLHLPYQSVHTFHHCQMIVLLLHSTHNHHRDNTLHTLHPDRHPTPINRIFPGSLSQGILVPKLPFITVHLDMHIPRADPPPQYRLAFPRNPDVIVGLSAAPGGGVEEYLMTVGERYVDDDRLFSPA